MWPFSRAKASTGPASGNDVLWLLDSARVEGVVAAASTAISHGSHVLLVTHVPGRVQSLFDAAVRAHLPVDGLATATTPDELAARLQGQQGERVEPCVFLALASVLKAPSSARNTSPRVAPGRGAPVLILVSDRHPLRERDDAIASFGGALAAERVEHHVCVEDPLLALFAGAATRKLVRMLGMQDHESLSHRGLTRSIARAQADIARTCPDHAGVEAWIADKLRT